MSTTLGERHGSESTEWVLLAFPLEVGIDVESVKGRIQSGVSGTKAQATFDVGHQRIEVGNVRPIKGLGEFSQDKLSPTGDLGGDKREKLLFA